MRAPESVSKTAPRVTGRDIIVDADVQEGRQAAGSVKQERRERE